MSSKMSVVVRVGVEGGGGGEVMDDKWRRSENVDEWRDACWMNLKVGFISCLGFWCGGNSLSLSDRVSLHSSASCLCCVALLLIFFLDYLHLTLSSMVWLMGQCTQGLSIPTFLEMQTFAKR